MEKNEDIYSSSRVDKPTSEAPLSFIRIFSPPLRIPESYLKSIGTSLGLKDFSYVSIEFNWSPYKALYYSYDPPHWQLIAIQFPIVPPLYYVGDDWSPHWRSMELLIKSMSPQLICSLWMIN